MRLLPHEKQLLIELYLKWAIPIDQYETRTADLAALTAEWNRLSGRSDSPEEVLAYMRSQRKQAKWVKLGDKAKPAPATVDLTAEETEGLVNIFNENEDMIDKGSDALAYDPEVADLIAKEFAAQTGRIVPANLLVAKLTALRKRGLLPKKECRPPKGAGWDDIDRVGKTDDGDQ
jgi:hypothetical protein